MRLVRIMMWITVFFGLCTAALTIMVILVPYRFGLPVDEATVASFVSMLLSGCMWGCAWVMSRARLRAVMIIGIVAGALAVAGTIAIFLSDSMEWFDLPWPLRRKVYAAVTTVGMIAVLAAQWGLASLLRLERPGWRRLRRITLVFSVFPVCCLYLAIWEAKWIEAWFRIFPGFSLRVQDTGFMIFGVLGVCVLGLTGLLLIGAIMEASARRQRSTSLVKVERIEMKCPSCGTSLVLPAGVGRCTNCSVLIRVAVEVPQCACGYVLYQLKKDRCPECGRALPLAQSSSSPVDEASTTAGDDSN